MTSTLQELETDQKNLYSKIKALINQSEQNSSKKELIFLLEELATQAKPLQDLLQARLNIYGYSFRNQENSDSWFKFAWLNDIINQQKENLQEDCPDLSDLEKDTANIIITICHKLISEFLVFLGPEYENWRPPNIEDEDFEFVSIWGQDPSTLHVKWEMNNKRCYWSILLERRYPIIDVVFYSAGTDSKRQFFLNQNLFEYTKKYFNI